MSRTEARRWLFLGLAAFALRAGAAVLTEYKPLFPAYYYNDAVFIEGIAWDMAQTWRSGVMYRSPYSTAQRAHAAALALPYAVVGRRPFVNKLINVFLGSVSVVLLGLAFRSLVSDDAAFAAAALVAAWPSHVFYTSQNFKESPALLFAFGALALLLPSLRLGAKPAPSRVAAGAIFLAFAGLLRSYVLVVLASSLAIGAALACRKIAGRKAAALTLAAALASLALYRGAEFAVFRRLISVPDGLPQVIAPAAGPAVEQPGRAPSPWTPAGIGRRRAASQYSDRAYAVGMGREVGTQIEPDARLETWLDLGLFLPRAAFQVLFMPLPGLYPMDGKLGRWLAAGENVALLLLAAIALPGLLRTRHGPPSAAVLAFFLIMLAGSALLEFDLGSSSRHKLLYLPMLFPFAAEELLRRRRA